MEFFTRVLNGFDVHDEINIVKADGKILTLDLRTAPLKEDDRVYGMVCFGQDITEHKKLEAQLFQAQKMETVGRLAGGIAHDFNNILTVIDGYCSMTIEDLKENHPLVSNIQTIRKASERAGNLTRQLLAFSRKQPMQTRALNLNSLVTDVAKMLHRVIGEDIKLIIDLFPELAEVQADPGQIEQVIMNLVINSRDAMPAGGQITIKTASASLSPAQAQAMTEAQPGNFVCLSIQDTGTGMSGEIQKHLFEPFFTTKERGKGTGLGLSVVYGIVKQHNGWVNVRSETGKGSVFDIYLPVAATPSTNQPDSKIIIKAFRPKGVNQRVLVIEDEQGIREVTAFGLRKSGYQVFEAATVAQARQIFEREKGNFDVIFSDVILPDGNGVKLAEELSALNPKIRIIISSGYMDEQAQMEAIDDKGYQFIPKPYNLTRLINTILKL
jgi:signal transduction histidine kinase/CheY-like chemotaxis protein